MGVLKHFAGVISEPIIAVHSSNDVTWRPPTPKWCCVFATRFQLWNFKQLLHII